MLTCVKHASNGIKAVSVVKVTCPLLNLTFVRYAKHWDPKFKAERRKKFIKVELPDYDELRKEKKLSPEEIRAKLKEKGVAPPRPWIEYPINISSTGGIFEPYVPPEGDGKLSMISMPGAKQKFEEIEKKGKSMLAIRKIRNFEDEFNLKVFAQQAQDIYIEAHNALVKKDEDRLHDLVTETCYPEMTFGMETKTIRWNFIESLELPRVVHARCTDVISKENVYAQVTLRMHTKQTLAIYDRFGRLTYGNDVVAKDVLEYVVFEKHLSNHYGLWRIHGKIVPEWLPPKDTFHKTFVKSI